MERVHQGFKPKKLSGANVACFSHAARYCCPKQHGSKVFELVTRCTFQPQSFFADNPEVVLAPHKDLKLWKVARAKQPLLCDKQIAKAGMPGHNPVLVQEFQKHQVNLALHNAYLANTISEDQIAFATSPAGCYTLQANKKKGQLKLVPAKAGNAIWWPMLGH